MRIYELHDSGIRKIILQSQTESDKFVIVILYNDDGTFGADYRKLFATIKEWGGYFYISMNDTGTGINKIFVEG